MLDYDIAISPIGGLMFTFAIIGSPVEGESFHQVNDAVFEVYRVSQPMSKQQIEEQEVLHYQDVARCKFPSLLFEIEPIPHPANESPDFYVRRSGRLIGLDATAFSFEERRGAAARFNFIRESLRLAFDQGRLQGCPGTRISLDLANREVDGQRALETDIEGLIESLDQIRMTPDVVARLGEFKVDAVGPGPYPIGESGSTANGAIKWHVQGAFAALPNIPGLDGFARHCGFFVEHYYRQTVTVSKIRAELDRIVAKHDKDTQKIDKLLIVSGGPGKYGNGVVGDTAAVQWFLHEGGQISEPKRLRRVVLNAWGMDTLTVLYERPEAQTQGGNDFPFELTRSGSRLRSSFQSEPYAPGLRARLTANVGNAIADVTAENSSKVLPAEEQGLITALAVFGAADLVALDSAHMHPLPVRLYAQVLAVIALVVFHRRTIY